MVGDFRGSEYESDEDHYRDLTDDEAANGSDSGEENYLETDLIIDTDQEDNFNDTEDEDDEDYSESAKRSRSSRSQILPENFAFETDAVGDEFESVKCNCLETLGEDRRNRILEFDDSCRFLKALGLLFHKDTGLLYCIQHNIHLALGWLFNHGLKEHNTPMGLRRFFRNGTFGRAEFDSLINHVSKAYGIPLSQGHSTQSEDLFRPTALTRPISRLGEPVLILRCPVEGCNHWIGQQKINIEIIMRNHTIKTHQIRSVVQCVGGKYLYKDARDNGDENLQPLTQSYGYNLFKDHINFVEGSSWVEVSNYVPEESYINDCFQPAEERLEAPSFEVHRLFNRQSAPTRNDDYIKSLHWDTYLQEMVLKKGLSIADVTALVRRASPRQPKLANIQGPLRFARLVEFGLYFIKHILYRYMRTADYILDTRHADMRRRITMRYVQKLRYIGYW